MVALPVKTSYSVNRPSEEVVELIKKGDTEQMDIDQCKVLSTLLLSEDDVSSTRDSNPYNH